MISQSQTPASESPDPRNFVMVVNAPGMKPTGPGSARMDFGEINPIKTPHWERTFTVRNTQSKPITLNRVSGSCGCTSLTLFRKNQLVQETTLAPGEEASVRVVLDLKRLLGEFHKFVWVYSPNTSSPLAAIELAGTVQSMVLFTPTFLPFGKVRIGESRMLPLKAWVDDSALGSGKLPVLRSTHTAVDVKPEGQPRKVIRNGRSGTEQDYHVTITSRATGGYLNGSLTYAPHKVSAADDLSIIGTSVSIFAEVIGGLAANPGIVLFGNVSSGKPESRTVTLTTLTGELPKDLNVKANSPYLKAALATTAAPRSRTLTVTLLPDAPPGPIQAEVALVSGTAELLKLNVIGQVVK